MSTKWDKANFASLDEAYKAAKMLGMVPTDITYLEEKNLRWFRTRDGMLIAQKGDEPVLQCRVAKESKKPYRKPPPDIPDKRMIAGEWHRPIQSSVEEYIDHLRRLPGDFQFTVETIHLVTHLKDGSQDEFRVTNDGLRTRYLYYPVYPLPHQ